MKGGMVATLPQEASHSQRREMYHKDALVLYRKRNPLSTCIFDSRIPWSLEKPMNLQSYDKPRDSDEHDGHVNN